MIEQSTPRSEFLAGVKAMIPLIIGGKDIRSGVTAESVMPHEHHHVLGHYHKATPAHVQQAIDAALNQLEQSARLTGRAIGVTAPYPLMVERLQVWLKGLPERGVALAPVSAMVK